MKTDSVALYFSDEMRYGLMSNTRRSSSKVGERAVLPHQQAYANKYLYSAVSPLSGESDLHAISGLTVIHLPSYSPELNPAERFFEEMRRATANKIFENIDAQETLIIEAVNRWSNNTNRMKQLLGYE